MKETTNKYNLHRYTKCQQLLTMQFQEPVIIASSLRNTHTHTHTHIYVHTHTHIYTHTHICTHTHTHIHIHTLLTHTHTRKMSKEQLHKASYFDFNHHRSSSYRNHRFLEMRFIYILRWRYEEPPLSGQSYSHTLDCWLKICMKSYHIHIE